MDNLKVYLVDIDEETEGVEKISFVEEPAFESNFMLYSKLHKYTIVDNDKRLVFGPIILANHPVLRNEPPHGWHYHKYTPKAIQRISEKYFKQKNTDKVNINHMIDVDGVYMVQSMIKDTAKGIDPAGYKSAQDGSWFGVFKVENDSVYQSVKDGDFNGFSMEINAKMADSGERIPLNIKFSKSNYMKKDLSTLDKWSRRRSFKSYYKKTVGKEPECASQILSKYGSVWTESGELSFDGDLYVGKEAFLFTDGNDPVIAPDGNYTITDGDRSGEVVTVVDGIITEITNRTSSDSKMETTDPINPEAESAVEQLQDAIENVDSVQESISELDQVKELAEQLIEKVDNVTSDYNKVNTKLSAIERQLKMPVETPEKTQSSYTAPSTVRDESGLTPRQKAEQRMRQYTVKQ